jgi:arylsulfatase A-like enzyme
MKKYLRCAKGVDDNVGRILDYLETSGLAENTIVIYTADQGFFLGEHGLYDKRFMYEEALRMPFLIRWPGTIKAGSVNKDIVLNVDFAPTILDAVGAEPHAGMQGRSFLSPLKGTTPADWRKSMYYRYYFSHFETEPHYGVRTDRYKLICFDRTGQWELYDLDKDPREMKNLYSLPACAGVVKDLKRDILRLQAELGDDVDDVGDKPRTGF